MSLQLTPAQQQIRQELEAINPPADPLPAKTPIVDVHTHTFNARYLPLEGIILGKRDAAPPYSWFVSDRCATIIARAVVDLTELGAAGTQPAVPREPERIETARKDAGLICGVFLKLILKAIEADAWKESMSAMTRMERAETVAEHMTLPERIAVRSAVKMLGMDEAMKGMNPKDETKGLVRFLWTLTQSDSDMRKLFVETAAGVPMRGEPLMVSHMMDLGPVYAQTADGAQLLEFHRQQVARMEHFQAQPDAGMLYFVAYNPYRNRGAAADTDPALDLVRDAMANHGAWGVKVYPPSGYRPTHNEVKDRPSPWFTRHPGRQWDARYAPGRPTADTTLNAELERLLLWCIANDHPVFVHCGTGEFEARKGYGVYHSDPQFWREFLQGHPERDGSPCKLRLCLGHGGGDDYWLGHTEHEKWGREVVALCREFPNVYCEVTTNSELTDPSRRAFFVDRLLQSFHPPGPADPRKPYSFADKLLYGTDWFLPDAAPRRDVLLSTQHTFLHPRLKPYYAQYFFGNALNFLNARARVNQPGIPPSLRAKLQELIAQADAFP